MQKSFRNVSKNGAVVDILEYPKFKKKKKEYEANGFKFLIKNRNEELKTYHIENSTEGRGYKEITENYGE